MPKEAFVLPKELSVLPKESNLSKKSLRKNLKVKIKLPIENMTKIPPKKERKIQKCCLVLFLLCLFILATGILIYFFGKLYYKVCLKSFYYSKLNFLNILLSFRFDHQENCNLIKRSLKSILIKIIITANFFYTNFM